jgi:hypothetical protein
MSVHVYIFAGEQNSGKTSVIQFLSNATKQSIKRKKVEISKEVKMLVEVLFKTQSLQEAGISADDFKEIVQKKLSQKHFSAVVIALRTENNINGLPAADCYIDKFAKFGWNIKYIAELGGGTKLQSYCKQNQYAYKSFKRTKKLPDSKLFAGIKKFFYC